MYRRERRQAKKNQQALIKYRLQNMQDEIDDAATIKPHFYNPDYQAMGDCRVCGHDRDKPWHTYGRDGRRPPKCVAVD